MTGNPEPPPDAVTHDKLPNPSFDNTYDPLPYVNGQFNDYANFIYTVYPDTIFVFINYNILVESNAPKILNKLS